MADKRKYSTGVVDGIDKAPEGHAAGGRVQRRRFCEAAYAKTVSSASAGVLTDKYL